MLTKIVGVTKSNIDPSVLQSENVTYGLTPTISKHPVTYSLEPTTVDEKDQVDVSVITETDVIHIGYIPNGLVEQYEFTQELRPGFMIDYSNGKLKNLSYQVDIDTEALQSKNMEPFERQVIGDNYLKVVGTTFRDFNPNDLSTTNPIIEDTVQTHQLIMLLEPEPTNEFDPNAVKVIAQSNSFKPIHIGYIPREFLEDYSFSTAIAVNGEMIDHSNGKMKQVNYKIDLDDLTRQVTKKNDLAIDPSDLEELETYKENPLEI